MNRPTLASWMASTGPQTLGISPSNVPGCAQAVNEAQQQLLHDPAQSDEGWSGTWAEIEFSVDRENPYITCPRGVARLEAVDVAGRPTQLQNQFYEFMLFGDGKLRHRDYWRNARWRRDGLAVARNNAVTYTDLKDGPQQIQIYAQNPLDTQPNPKTGQIPRVLVQGICRGKPIVTQDGNNTVQGEFVTLASPFATTKFDYHELTGIQKDVTLGNVQIFQSDPYWGSLELLSELEPTETTGWYRRYYLHQMPSHCPRYVRWQNVANANCACRPREYVLISALAKLDLIPVTAPTDYLTIPNLGAITYQAQAIRMSKMDDPGSRTQSEMYHRQALRLLIGQAAHENGKNQPTINWRPWGSEGNIERYRLGMT